MAGRLKHQPNFGGSILVNFEFTPVGGCHQEVKPIDEIFFAFDTFNANAFLKLTGLAIAIYNPPAFFTVTDGQTGKPVAGATLNGGTLGGVSNDNGQISSSVIFHLDGPFEVKATKPHAILSNGVTILVA